jgi:hypothetical protein
MSLKIRAGEAPRIANVSITMGLIQALNAGSALLLTVSEVFAKTLALRALVTAGAGVVLATFRSGRILTIRVDEAFNTRLRQRVTMVAFTITVLYTLVARARR